MFTVIENHHFHLLCFPLLQGNEKFLLFTSAEISSVAFNFNSSFLKGGQSGDLEVLIYLSIQNVEVLIFHEIQTSTTSFCHHFLDVSLHLYHTIVLSSIHYSILLMPIILRETIGLVLAQMSEVCVPYPCINRLSLVVKSQAIIKLINSVFA